MPTSYRASNRGDQEKSAQRTFSQSLSSNGKVEMRRVGELLDARPSDAAPITITADATISDAVAVLKEKQIGALLVTDANGALEGILSERDIVRKLADTPGATLPQSVRENMTHDVVTCGPNDVLVDVLKQMSAGRFRHMPVVEDGTLLGMVTVGDVVNYRLQELEHEALQLKQLIVG